MKICLNKIICPWFSLLSSVSFSENSFCSSMDQSSLVFGGCLCAKWLMVSDFVILWTL